MVSSTGSSAVIPLNGSYKTILFCFKKHNNPKYQWFSNMLNSIYSSKIDERKYKKLFVDPTTKNTMVVEGYDRLSKIIDDLVLNKSIHTAGQPEQATIKTLLSACPIMYMNKNGHLSKIDDTDDLAQAFDAFDNGQSNDQKVISQDGNFFVIFKESSMLYPASKDATGMDWT